MNREILKAKIAEAISSQNTSGNEKLEMILAAADAYSSADNGAKPIVSRSLPLSEDQISELASIGSKYVYEGVMEDGRISYAGILEVIKKYEEFKRQ